MVTVGARGINLLLEDEIRVKFPPLVKKAVCRNASIILEF